MNNEHSDWKENMQDKLQEIKDKRQSAQEQSGQEPQEQDSDIGFLQEEIKKRPRNRKKMMRQMMMIAIMAAVFGSVACLFFLLLEPVFTKMIYPEEAVTGVTYPEESEIEELTPEEMIVNEEEKAATEEQEKIRVEVERYLQDKEKSAKAVARYYLVDVSEISSDTDWFNDPYETRGTVSGMIIAKTDSEIQVLTYSPGIDSAETIQVTLFDGTALGAEIHAYDRVSGFAVLTAGLDEVSEESKKQIVPVIMDTLNHDQDV